MNSGSGGGAGGDGTFSQCCTLRQLTAYRLKQIAHISSKARTNNEDLMVRQLHISRTR